VTGVNPFLKKAAPRFEVGEKVTVDWDAQGHGRLRHTGVVTECKQSRSGVWVAIDGGQNGVLKMFDYSLRRIESPPKKNPFMAKKNPFIEKANRG
jgi:hypothetical protein